MRFQSWSETRWVKIGRCGRMFLRGLAVGIEGIVQVAQQDDCISKYRLGGFERLSGEVRLLLAVAGFAARPVEAVQLELLRDDRLLRLAPMMRRLLDDEVRKLA
eukprot:3241095-Alexandrium_andersonii.AAC.1